MSSTDNDHIKLYKQPLTTSQLILSLLFATYFLTVQTIELSLSIYVLQENKIEVYSEYSIFKRQAPIWKWWQLLSTMIVLLSIITAIRNLIQIFTKRATFKRNSLDVLKALQLFIVLYISITRILPLENKLIQAISKDTMRELNAFQWIIFPVNILGWFIPIFQYQDGKNEKHIHSKTKTE